MRCVRTLSVIVMCAMTSIASAGILLVPADYGSIQSGIDAAVDGDTVLVSPGVYYETIDFLGKAITVQSSDNATTTFIDGSSSSGSVVRFATSETALSVLDGFRIRNGSSVSGGGIYMLGASPIIRNSTLTGNHASSFGGGLFVESSEPTLENVTIDGNTTSGAGGGMYLKFSSGSMTGGSLSNNSATNGGGIYAKDGTVVFFLSNVAIQRNTALSNGGGVFAKNCRLTVDNSTFDVNAANRGGGWFSWADGAATLTDCSFTSNSAIDVGGAANIRSSIVTFVRATFDSNQADSDCDGIGGGGAIDIVNSLVTLEDPTLCTNKSCDVFNDFSGDAPIINGSIQTCASFGACCGGTSCWEMLEIECFNGGGVWNGPDTVCAAVTCVGGVDVGACCIAGRCIMASDAACMTAGGIFDGVGVACSTVQCPITGCPSDLNHDGAVTVTDLLEVIQAWGACP